MFSFQLWFGVLLEEQGMYRSKLTQQDRETAHTVERASCPNRVAENEDRFVPHPTISDLDLKSQALGVYQKLAVKHTGTRNKWLVAWM
jgi:hypothetical protein